MTAVRPARVIRWLAATPARSSTAPSFATAIREARRYSVGGNPAARWKRAKNAERDRAASPASSATVQPWSGRACMARREAARRSSARAWARPGTDAIVPSRHVTALVRGIQIETRSPSGAKATSTLAPV